MHLPHRPPRPHNPMPESPVEVLALFTAAMIGASLFIMSTGALAPFFRAALGLNQTQLGMLLSVQFAGSVGMTSVAGVLTDRFGDKAMVLWSGVLMGIALLAASLVPSYGWLVGWLLIYGIGFAAVTPAGSHAIIYFFKPSDRGLAMGVRQCGIPLAGVIGSVFLPLVAIRFHYQGALAAAGMLTLLAGFFASRLYREPHELEGERISLRALFADMVEIARDARLILLTLTSMVLVCGQMALVGFWTLTLVHRADYPLSAALPLFTLSQLAAAGGRLSWGWLSDRFFAGSRALPLATNCVLVGAIALAVAAIGTQTPLWAAAALAVALGFTAEGWFGVAIIGFAEIGGEERSGSALGVGLSWTLLAAFVTPALFGALAQARGYDVAWRSLAVLSLAGVVPALLASRMAIFAAAKS